MTDPLDPMGLEAAAVELYTRTPGLGEIPSFEHIMAGASLSRWHWDHEHDIIKASLMAAAQATVEAYLAASRENASPSEHRCVSFEMQNRERHRTLFTVATCECGWACDGQDTDEAAIDLYAEHYAQASEAALRAENAELRIGIGKAEFNSGKKKELKRNLHRSRDAYAKVVVNVRTLMNRWIDEGARLKRSHNRAVNATGNVLQSCATELRAILTAPVSGGTKERQE